MAEDWFLVQFKPNSHRVADKNLRRQGFVTFLPLHEVTRRQASRFVSELRPLFPGYMFVRLDPTASPWRKVNSTYGVSRIVSFSDSPTPAPAGLMAGLLSRCDDAGRLLVHDDLSSGQAVKVIDGPFADFVGTVEAIDPDRRIWILLDFMGQPTRIQVGTSQVSSLR